MSAIEQLFSDIQSELGKSYTLDNCDKMLLKRGFVRGALEQLKNPIQTANLLEKLRRDEY